MKDKRRRSQRAFGAANSVRIQQPAAFRHNRPLRYEYLEDRCLLAADFGDAPFPYPTLLADNGPRHEAVGPILGYYRDTESDGLPQGNAAAGDDLLGSADENGVVFGSFRVGQLDASITVTVTNEPFTARLDAWMDFDRDGSWSGAQERIAASVELTSGVHEIHFDIPSTAAPGDTFARFRLSSLGGLGPAGPAVDGEVEDYHVTLLPPVASGGQFGLLHAIASEVNEQTVNTAGTIGISAADLDNDGDMDVIASAALDGILSWYENQDAHGFVRHEIAANLPWVNEIVPTDLDQDGDLDLVTVAARDGYSLVWHENDGAGSFQTHLLVGSETDGARAMEVVDIDIDGDLDILVARDYVDMGYASAELVLYRNTNNQFAAEVLATSDTNGNSLDAADIDQDGDIDIVETVWSTRGVNLLRQQDGQFTRESLITTVGYGNAAIAAQFDNEGGLDILVNSWSDGGIRWLQNSGTSFARHELFSYGGTAGPLWSADMNGDGKLDVLRGDGRTVSWTNVLNNQGYNDTNVVVQTEYPVDLDPVDFYPADMDGDGDLDVVVASGEADRIAWYENTDYRIGTEFFWSRNLVEGDPSAPNFNLTFYRYGPVEEALTIMVSLGGAAVWGVDYEVEGFTNVTSTTAQLTFLAGQNYASFTVESLQDSIYELDETVDFQVIDGWDYQYAEVEPLRVVIVDDDAADFGDAPFPYPTPRASNGAKHGASGPRLGIDRDEELDGPPAGAASGDNSVGSADEDGVTWGTIRVGQLDAEMTVDVQSAAGTAFVDAWLDLNGDGNWAGAGEQILARAQVVNGINVLKFAVPPETKAGSTHARLRLSSAGGLSYLGAAIDGEVEDYQVTVMPPAAAIGRFVPHNIATSTIQITEGIGTGDIDRDGDIDIVSISYGGLRLHENLGNGNFSEHVLSRENAGFHVRKLSTSIWMAIWT